MLISAVTHADARSSKRYNFRGLTDQGQREARDAARRYRKMVSRLANYTGRQIAAIDSVVSSPKPRCLETVILLAKELSDLMTAGEVALEAGIQAGAVNGPELAELAERVGADHLLVAGHADLAKTLPPTAELMPDATKDGWFSCRPVLLVIAYDPVDGWDEATVLACEGLIDGSWQGLLAP